MPPLVSIITVNYNGTALLLEMLAALERCTYPEKEIIVVDNASEEDPSPVLRARHPAVKVLRSERNLGFAGANNLGLREARGTFFFLLNNDAWPEPSALSTLVRFLETHPDAGAVSPLICFPAEEGQETRVQFAGATDLNLLTARNRTLGRDRRPDQLPPHPHPIPFAHGAAMLVPRRVVEAVGPLSEDFFLYYEELDWCARMRKAGWTIYLEPRAQVFHHESHSIGAGSPLKCFWQTRNRLLFARKHFPSWAKPLVWSYFLGVALPVNLFRHRKSADHRKAFLRGVAAHLQPGKWEPLYTP
ncbi:MAG: glycosyltransferase family 2 protein, partial [Bacteroidetes bacterium]